MKQAVFKPLTASSSEVNYNSGLGILLPTSPSANLHPQKHQAKITISSQASNRWAMQPSTSSATSATTMEVSTFQTLEDAKSQANRKWRISFSKIKILQEATSFDLYADGLFGNEMHSKIQHAVLFDLCNDSLPSLFSTSSKAMVFGSQTHRPSEKVGPPNLHSK